MDLSTDRSVVTRGLAVGAAGLALLAATSCTDDQPPAGQDELGAAVQRLSDDPAAARDFLSGGRPEGTAEAIDAAGVPGEGRVAWLVAGSRGWSDQVTDDVGATLVAATSEPDAARDEQAATVLAQVLRSAGEPETDDDTVDPRLRGALADAAAAQPAELFDALATAARREPDWHLDPAREFLVEVSRDDHGRQVLQDALVTEADERLGPTPEARLQARNEEVGIPLGRMVGTLVRGGDRSAYSDERQELERTFELWARQNTDDRELATNVAGDVGAVFIDQFSDRWDATTEPA